MQYSGNQLGNGPEKKSLTNEEISETLSKLTGDSEQAKKIFDQSENVIPLTNQPSKPDRELLI